MFERRVDEVGIDQCLAEFESAYRGVFNERVEDKSSSQPSEA